MDCRVLTEKDKREICSWRYQEEYAVYNLPSWDNMCAAGYRFVNPEHSGSFLGFWLENVLMGYVSLKEDEQAMEVGIGLRPDFCGRGYGTEVLKEACRTAVRCFPSKPLRLEVRAWNHRAIRCYEKAGFAVCGVPYSKEAPGGQDMFILMEDKENLH